MPRKIPKKQTTSPAVKQSGSGRTARSISISPVWEQRLKELEAFKKENGHCNVSHKYSLSTPLASWVAYVRYRKQTGTLDSELARRLDGLGFTWELRHRTVRRWDWDAMVAALEAFKNQHGHCHIPLQPATYRALGVWLVAVRHRKRTGQLDRRRIQQLDRLGIEWEPNDKKWETAFADLVAYRAKYDDCNVPYNWPENPKLASWVRMQQQFRKRNTLPQDRLERLDKIGFAWTRVEGAAWEANYAAWSNTSRHTVIAGCLLYRRIMPVWAVGSIECVYRENAAS